jgi:hypothetical protein
MATVTYRRGMFPGKLLKARPMARSRVTTDSTEFVKIAETERNSKFRHFFGVGGVKKKKKRKKRRKEEKEKRKKRGGNKGESKIEEVKG